MLSQQLNWQRQTDCGFWKIISTVMFTFQPLAFNFRSINIKEKASECRKRLPLRKEPDGSWRCRGFKCLHLTSSQFSHVICVTDVLTQTSQFCRMASLMRFYILLFITIMTPLLFRSNHMSDKLLCHVLYCHVLYYDILLRDWPLFLWDVLACNDYFSLFWEHRNVLLCMSINMPC